MTGEAAPPQAPVPLGAPDPEHTAEVLKERYHIAAEFDVKLSYPDSELGHPHVSLRIDRPVQKLRPRERYVIDVEHREGGPDKDRWPVTMNAMDTLVGLLIEADYAHRDLPSGEGLEFEEALFAVRVSCIRPDLEAEADRWLATHPESADEPTPH